MKPSRRAACDNRFFLKGAAMSLPLEIERKFLIRMPDTAALAAQPGATILHLTQTYLLSAPGLTARVRMIKQDGCVRYVRTEKRRLSDRTAIEEEYEIDEKTYRDALRVSDPERLPIKKTRYAIPYEGHVMEVDIYTFWNDRATLEIELSSEEEAFTQPPYLSVIAEVTADRRYKNAQLAKEIPLDELPPEEI
jgi:CYTH domain-containing protein